MVDLKQTLEGVDKNNNNNIVWTHFLNSGNWEELDDDCRQPDEDGLVIFLGKTHDRELLFCDYDSCDKLCIFKGYFKK